MTTIKSGTVTTATKSLVATTSSGDKVSLTPPEIPALEKFALPKPKFDSNLQRHYRFGYFFGIDDAVLQSRNINMTCGKVTNEIQIGSVDTIELEATYHISSSSSVEFFIVDQDKEVPIIPVGDPVVRNERIFFGIPLRFAMDRSQPYQIKKDGVDIDMTPEAVISKNDGVYTITYTPLNAQQYKPVSDKIQIKVIMRLYSKLDSPPFVKSALIRTYGGDALWTDRL